MIITTNRRRERADNTNRGPLASWLTGWSNWLGQITAAPSVNYGTASMILAMASIGNPSFVPQNWHVYLVTALIMCVNGCISSMPTRWLAKFNAAGKSNADTKWLCVP